MNVLSPVSTIMTTRLKAVNPEDSLERVKAIFDEFSIHHIPVVRYKEIVGLISKSDFLHFLKGFVQNDMDKFIEQTRLKTWTAKEIMTVKLAKIESSEPIRTALELFKINRFHALPVVDDGELVGIITTYDIIAQLAGEPVPLENYAAAKA